MLDESILEAEHMDPGFSDHATDVLRVRTRALRIFGRGEERDGQFWDGLIWLFGRNLQDAAGVAARHRLLCEAGG